MKCKICGNEVTPRIDKHYISRNNSTTGFVAAFKYDEAELYDTFDCPTCGCQIIAQERKRCFSTADIPACKEEQDTEFLIETEAPEQGEVVESVDILGNKTIYRK